MTSNKLTITHFTKTHTTIQVVEPVTGEPITTGPMHAEPRADASKVHPAPPTVTELVRDVVG
jgi:hypothetical protein